MRTNPFTSRARTTVGLAVGTSLLAALAAYGATSGADEAAITSTQEWCDVALQLDAVIGDRTSSNTIHHQLQDVWAEARPLVVQLLDGIEHVDADHRDGVSALGEDALSIADAIAAAPDQRAAEAAVADLVHDADPAAEAGAAWVVRTCDRA
jgi:hypothetical protein